MKTLRDFLGLSVVLVGALFLLRPLLHAGFVIDDFHLIHITTLSLDLEAGIFGNLKELARYYVIEPSPHFKLYRSSVLLSFGLNALTTGTDPWFFQVTNLTLHLTVGVALFLTLRRLVPDAGTVAVSAATALFLVSPVQLEVVSWSAARSDSISLLFGLLAIWVKLLGRRIWLPAILVAVALTAKESALTFLAALWLLDWTNENRSEEPLWRSALRALVPLLAVFAVYSLIRLCIFGSFFGAYGAVDSEEYSNSMRYAGNLSQSLAVFFAPISDLVMESLLNRLPLVAAAFAAFTILASQLLLFVGRSQDRAAVIGALLLFMPILLGVIVNPATQEFVGTRALYTPMAGLALLLTLGQQASRGRRGRWIPLAFLLGLALALNRPCQEPHLDVSSDIDATLESIWTALENDCSAPVESIIILGYEESRYFAGSYDMSNAIRKALDTPFLEQEHPLSKVACTAEPAPNFVAFHELFNEGDLSASAIFMMQRQESSNRLCELVSPPAIAPEGARLELFSPVADSLLHLDFNEPDLRAPSFRIRVAGVEAAALRFTLYNCYGRVSELASPIEEFAAIPDGDGELIDIILPLPALERPYDLSAPFGWSVSLLDAEGEILAHSPVRLIRAKFRARRP